MKPLIVVKFISDKYGIDISGPTLHHWETVGLLPDVSRKDSQHRDYSKEDVEKIETVAVLRYLGFAINTVKQYLDGDKFVIQMSLRNKLPQFSGNLIEKIKELIND